MQMSDCIRSASRIGRRRVVKAMAAGAVCALGRSRPAQAMSAERTTALLAARLAEQGVGLVALQVDKAGVAIAAVGLASTGEPLRDDARFEIGSITKTFTALLLADAVVRRELLLD